MESLVSVIVPAYNHEKYVQDAIKSIIAQTYKNIELIVFDDGSKDNTWNKIQELKEESEKRFVRVLFETKENEGTCKTLNKMISSAHGEYIYLIASDDLAKPHAIEKEVNFLSSNPEYGLVVGNDEIIDSDGKLCFWDKNRKNVYSRKEAKYFTFVEFIESDMSFKLTSEKFGSYDELYLKNHVPNGYLIRKSIFEKTGLYVAEAPLEDWYIMLQISKYVKMKYIDEVLFSYRWHGENTALGESKIIMMTQKTRLYEEEILSKINVEEVFPVVLKIKKEGYCYKKIGIPFIFQVFTTRKAGRKYKTIKLFNIKIFEYKK